MLSTTLWHHAKMSTVLKSPKGLKDLECKKGQLSSRPPIPYVPLADQVATKEAPESLNPDENVFNMSIFSQGNNKEFLAHVIIVLCLIIQKRLDVQCRKLANAVDKLARMLENLQMTVGTRGAITKDEMESCKFEIGQTQEILQVLSTMRLLPRHTSF
jgi:hypothetical protein